MTDDAELWGINPTALPQKHDEDHAVWHENLNAVQAFLRVRTQWSVVGIGMAGMVTVGLNYAGVKIGLDCAGIEITPELWDDLLVIEAGAVEALNEGLK